MKRLLRWIEIPIHLFLWLGLLAGLLMMLHVTADVTGRYGFSRPIEGTTETVAAYYMVAIAYLPWAYLARHDRHIVAGIFTRIGSPRFDFWVEIGVKLLTTAYVSVFVYRTFLPHSTARAPAKSGSPAPSISRSGRAAGCCRSRAP